MSRFIKTFLLLSITMFGSLVANESANLYQKHLPPKIYEYVIGNDLLDLAEDETVTEKQNLEGLDQLTIDSDTYKGKKLACITFWPENRNKNDNFGGYQVGYHNGKIMCYAVFDAKGRDYVADGPLSEEDEKKLANFLILLMEGGIAKVREEFLEQSA